MEKAIRRGKVLREILKQDRLNPLPVEFQMAWLIAFNEGLFDSMELETLAGQLRRLQRHVAASGLQLKDDRELWLKTIRAWLGVTGNEGDEPLPHG